MTILETIDQDKNNSINKPELDKFFLNAKPEQKQEFVNDLEQNMIDKKFDLDYKSIVDQINNKPIKTLEDQQILGLLESFGFNKKVSVFNQNLQANFLDKLEIVANITLPNINFHEGFSKSAIDKLNNRFQMNFPNDYQKVQMDVQVIHKNKPSQFKSDYIKYYVTQQAVSKYQEILDPKLKTVREKTGYKSEKECQDEVVLLENFNKSLEQQLKINFPKIEKSIQVVTDYSAKMQKLKDPGIDKNNISNPSEFTSAGIQKYMQNLEKATKYQADLKNIVDSLGGQELVENSIGDVKNYKNYTASFAKGFGINYDRVMRYMGELDKQGLSHNIQDIGAIHNILNNPTQDNTSPFFGLVLEAQQKQEHQQKLDARWMTIKAFNPLLYQTCNVGISMRNATVDSLIGTGTGLGLMISSLYKNENELSANINRKENRDNALKIGESSNMQKSLYDENGLNWEADNVISNVAKVIPNIVVLLTGAGGISQGVNKLGVKAGSKLLLNNASNIGLFSSSMTISIGQSFLEAKQQGLSDKQAFGFSLVQSLASSSLELIAPNKLFMGQFSDTVKSLIGKEGSKKTMGLLVAKNMAKNLGKEIGEENIQEFTQNLAQKFINYTYNQAGNFDFDANVSLEDITTTALLTSISTGLISIKGSHTQAKMDLGLNPKEKLFLKYNISQNPVMYTSITTEIDGLLKDNKFSPEDAAELLQLKVELEAMKSGKKQIQENVEASVLKNESQIDSQTVDNSQLSNPERISKAKELLKSDNLTPEQEIAILEAHNQPGELNNLTFGQIKSRMEILQKVGFDKGQIKILMDNGICGKSVIENIEETKTFIYEFIKLLDVSGAERAKQLKELKIKYNNNLIFQSIIKQTNPNSILNIESALNDVERQEKQGNISIDKEYLLKDGFRRTIYNIVSNIDGMTKDLTKLLEYKEEEKNVINQSITIEKPNILNKWELLGVSNDNTYFSDEDLSFLKSQVDDIFEDNHEKIRYGDFLNTPLYNKLDKMSIEEKIKLFYTIFPKDIENFDIKYHDGELKEKGLTEIEIELLKRQTVNSVDVNKVLWNVNYISKMTAFKTKLIADIISNGMNKLSDYSGEIYRYVKIDSDIINKIDKTGIVENKGFTSCTKDMETMENQIHGLSASRGGITVLFKIKDPIGAKDISKYSYMSYQNEVLMVPGNNWEVVNKYSKINKTLEYNSFYDIVYEVEGIKDLKTNELENLKSTISPVITENSDLSDSERIAKTEESKNDLLEKNYNRNTEKREMKEIDRKSDVIAIGDLGGKVLIFKNALKKNNLINESGDWIGGNTKIVLQGDILGDSGSTSFDVFEMINKINNQAEKQGGEILVITGNHDRLLIDLLVSQNIYDYFEKIGDKYIMKHSGKNSGLNELGQFMGGDTDIDITNERNSVMNDGTLTVEQRKSLINEKRQKLLENIRNSEYGENLLESITKTKIMEQLDDCLYIHVSPHNDLLKFIENNSKLKPDGSMDVSSMIDEINSLWQKYLRKELLGENIDLSKEDQEKILEIKEIFLSENGTYSTSEDKQKYDMLKNSGINIIQHGHIGKERIIKAYGVEIKANDDCVSKNKDHKINKGLGYNGLESSTNIEGKQVKIIDLSSKIEK